MFEPYSLEWHMVRLDADQEREIGKSFIVLFYSQFPGESTACHTEPLREA